MRNQRQLEIFIYRAIDFFTAMLAWFLFFCWRKEIEGFGTSLQELFNDQKLILGLFFIPIGWLIIYSVFDKYSDIYRYSRFATLIRTFWLTLLGVAILFFTVLLDDDTLNYTNYIEPFFRLFFLHFGLTAFARVVYLTYAKTRLKNGKVKYNALIIGGDSNAVELFEEITKRPHNLGLEFVGFVDANGKSKNKLKSELPMLGNWKEITQIVEDNNIEEVIIAIEKNDHDKIKHILDSLYDTDEHVLIKIIPDMYDILIGSVKMNSVYDEILLPIERGFMPKWERIVKRVMDIFVAILVPIILLPVFVLAIIRVKFSSPGPIFFLQERIGKNAKPFNIIKFRSMYTDAESAGPALSSDDDPRTTNWGKIMRKWRIDELPQFVNVLKGEMSLVGPRPERQFYIDQIMSEAPHYRHLLKIRPGITSWGQVKYGYASDLKQMLQRLKYDMMYIENMSLSLDIKILLYTVLVIVQGKGK